MPERIRNEFIKYVTPSALEKNTTKEDWKRQLELCITLFDQARQEGKDIKGNSLNELDKQDLMMTLKRCEKQLEILEKECN